MCIVTSCPGSASVSLRISVLCGGFRIILYMLSQVFAILHWPVLLRSFFCLVHYFHILCIVSWCRTGSILFLYSIPTCLFCFRATDWGQLSLHHVRGRKIKQPS